MTEDLSKVKKVAGIRQVIRGINANTIKFVYLATDAAASYKKIILETASQFNIPVLEEGLACEFKLACGIDVDTFCIGVLNNY